MLGVVGAIAGAGLGREGLHAEWLNGISEWPRSVVLLEKIALRLFRQKGAADILGPVRYFWAGLIPRNILFLLVVIVHGLR